MGNNRRIIAKDITGINCWYIMLLLESRGIHVSDITEIVDKVDKCVCCGAPIPEGRMICYKCEREEGYNGKAND